MDNLRHIGHYHPRCRYRCCLVTTLQTHTLVSRPLFRDYPGGPVPERQKPIWILLKQETVSGSSIGWAVCKSAPRSRQITTPAPHHSVFTGRMPFLPPYQQRQSTEGICQCQCQSEISDVSRIAELLRSPRRRSRVTGKGKD